MIPDPVRFRKRLLSWYRRNKRGLPWRATRDPYRIWISEVMLQQTRVQAVIPFYERFLDRFPDVGSLAAASEPDLLAAWAGLGYYSRARNLQKAAVRILECGRFPEDYETIRALPGVGSYTAAAVASIAFGWPAAAVDGNVVRVLSRLTAEPGNVALSAVRARLTETANLLLDSRRPGEFNQAMMELGATVCAPDQPRCLLCPVQEHCAAKREGTQREYPAKRLKSAAAIEERQLLAVVIEGCILLWRRPPDSRRMAGFWELPERRQLPDAVPRVRLGQFRHTIVNTNYRLEVWDAFLEGLPAGFRFWPQDHLGLIPLSTTARKALRYLSRGI